MHFDDIRFRINIRQSFMQYHNLDNSPEYQAFENNQSYDIDTFKLSL
jgi:hypothetical protein